MSPVTRVSKWWEDIIQESLGGEIYQNHDWMDKHRYTVGPKQDASPDRNKPLPQIPEPSEAGGSVYYPNEAHAEMVYTTVVEDVEKHSASHKRAHFRTRWQSFSKSWRRIVARHWLSELGYWVLGFALLSGVIGILATHQRQPIPQWPLSITLGGLISLLATVATFCFTIPVASGLSQFKWIWFLREKRRVKDFQAIEEASQNPLASMILLSKYDGGFVAVAGAILMVATLAIAPFTQQMISYENRELHDNTASVPVVRSYAPPTGVLISRDLGSGMKAAFWNGILSPHADPSVFNVAANCPTGNCVWPTYRSLGVCSKCRDLSSLITKTKTKIKDVHLYSVPSLSVEVGATQTLANLATMKIRSSAWFSPEEVWSALGIKKPMLNFTAISGPVDPPYRQQVGPFASECVLYTCVREYSAKSVNGSFTETPGKILSSQVQNIGVYDNHTYTFDTTAYQALQYYLLQHLNASISVENGLGPIQQFHNDAVPAVYAALNNTAPHTLDKLFGNVARSLTSQMRLSGGSGPLAIGRAMHKQAYVTVRWAWLAGPLTISVAILAYMFLVQIMTRRAGLEPWKASSVATLFHGLDNTSREGAMHLTTLDDLEDAAKKLVVRLTRSNGNWELRSTAIG